ncbi:hypothetical protein CC85DRAFT_282053 [Cutaneotrichosporon oleaginosum]|uniref:Uncharacterized protein n=1 Tax=Cutaneotrichosporon oleaginosum TaxID=879819 RepID=A0A0J1BCY4_9TREE|nr:uncharacterized protein CC85DRAFT_282053 [Cutaneotrichosporon oleaginosum]KLT45909.1 hypothetical protein CC85DRAFT_282053 [Cutaneotrichosporon oleaginosum]TXT06607.1 hypothetical protein COLE_05938 [Cutaneotrichosporon oleaginosum]
MHHAQMDTRCQAFTPSQMTEQGPPVELRLVVYTIRFRAIAVVRRAQKARRERGLQSTRAAEQLTRRNVTGKRLKGCTGGSLALVGMVWVIPPRQPHVVMSKSMCDG